MDVATLLTSVSTTLSIIDQIADPLSRFIRKRPPATAEKPPSVVAKPSAGAIALVQGDQTVETITADDLKELDPAGQQLIQAIEQSMAKQFKLWTQLYPLRNSSTDALANAKIDRQLDDIARTMCVDLHRLLQFLESLGKRLFDHYHHVRFVCTQITEPAGKR